jgi:hypothetical protein
MVESTVRRRIVSTGLPRAVRFGNPVEACSRCLCCRPLTLLCGDVRCRRWHDQSSERVTRMGIAIPRSAIIDRTLVEFVSLCRQRWNGGIWNLSRVIQVEFPVPQIRPTQTVTMSEVRAVLKILRRGINLIRTDRWTYDSLALYLAYRVQCFRYYQL